jgi:hypothetical protein
MLIKIESTIKYVFGKRVYPYKRRGILIKSRVYTVRCCPIIDFKARSGL